VTTVDSTQLVTSVNQCNNITEVGGSNVYCNVNVTNNVPVGTPTAAVTVDQCIGSATTSTENCDPTSSTTTATVTQCNGSATGGGNYAGQNAVACTVTGGTSALPVTVTQCNNTAIGAGSSVTCHTTYTNNFVAPVTPATPTSGTGGSGTTSAGGGTGTTATTPVAPGGSGATGLTGSAAGAGGSTGPPTIVGTLGAIPAGAPQTGFGGASRSTDSDFFFPAAIAFMAAGLAASVAIRRRRTHSLEGANETT
jgi:hypothetical protein